MRAIECTSVGAFHGVAEFSSTERRHGASQRLAILLVSLCLVLVVGNAGAVQSHPNVTRGFNSETLFQLADLDAVNTFNGNLMITVPIGQEYRVGGNLTYAFKLVYNGQVWSFRGIEPADAIPGSQSNVALGWQFTLGELTAPEWSYDATIAPSRQWAFHTPDGGKHVFYKVLHPDHLETDLEARRNDSHVYGYTRDMSYLRLVGDVESMIVRGERENHAPVTAWFGKMTVEMPNGTVYVFRAAPVFEALDEPAADVRYYLHYVADAFGNKLQIDYLYQQPDANGALSPDLTRDPEDADAQQISEMPASGQPGRTHTVLFSDEDWYQTKYPATGGAPDYKLANTLPQGALMKKRVVKEIQLSARGGTAVYQFDSELRTIAEPCDAFIGWRDRRMKARLLTAIRGPEGLTYQAMYRELGPSNACSETAGHIIRLSHPSGAAIDYELDRRRFPLVPDNGSDPRFQCGGSLCDNGGFRHFFCSPEYGGGPSESSCINDANTRTKGGGDHRPPFSDPVSVAKRTVTGPFTTTSTHVYKTTARCNALNAERFQEMVVMTDAPGGERTLNYFIVDPSDVFNTSEYPGKIGEYALPFSKASKSNLSWAPGYFLSTETMATACDPFPSGLMASCDVANQCDAQVVRRTYVKYEVEPYINSDTLLDGPSEGVTDLNRRLLGTITITRKFDAGEGKWVDDICPDQRPCHTKVEYDDYDGLGHFRKEIRTSNNTLSRTVNNADMSRTTTIAYQQTVPQPNQRWLFGQYQELEVEEGGAEAKLSEFCWDGNGFMTRKHEFRGLSDTPDSLTGYTADADGNLASESRYAVLADFSTCEGDLGTPLGTITNTWKSGALAVSEYAGAPFQTLDLDIDAATGLATASRDGNERTTCYEYDLLGRLKMMRPPGAAESWYEYFINERPIRVVAKQMPASTAPCATAQPQGESVTESHYYYDGLGRLIQEKRRMPDGWATVSHGYDASGRKASVSVPQPEPASTFSTADAEKTTYAYDVLGRPTLTVSPDGGGVERKYAGDREVSRGAKVATTPGDNAPANQTLFWTTELYDGFGRLAEVQEPFVINEPLASTGYDYDFGDRLSSVVNGQNPRAFTYDRSGLLIAETYPEMKKDASRKYTYDARGRRVTSELGSTISLMNHYDAADRLKKVVDQSTGNTLQEFFFDADEGSSEPGKLMRQVRNNYFSDSKYVVTDRLRYDSVSGRLASKATEVAVFDAAGNAAGTRTVSQQYTYDNLGQPAAINFPLCQNCGTAFPFQARTLALNWSDGLLTSIAGVAKNIAYGPNGAVTRLVHATSDTAAADGVIDDYQQDLMARPERIKFTNVRDCSLILSQPASARIAEGQAALFTLETAPGATIQWYQGQTGDTSTPIANAVNLTFVTPLLTESRAYWARVTAPGGGCSEDTLTVTATVCKAPVVRTPKATVAVRAFVNVPLTFFVDVAGVVSYSWSRRVGDDGPLVSIPGGGSSATYTPTESTQPGSPLKILVTVETVCNADRWTVEHLVAILDVVQPAVCAAQFDTVRTNIFPKTLTIMPNEPTELIARLNMVGGEQIGSTYPKLRYSFRWYQDGQLSKTEDRMWTLGMAEPASPEDEPQRSDYRLQFVNQTHLRMETWVSCYETADANEQTPAQVSERLSKETFGVMNGHCPVPGVSVKPVDMQIGGSGTLKAETVYPDARFQWYEGESGNTAHEAFNGKSRELVVSEPGTYWVRVSSECGAFSDSATVTVSKGQCQPVRILRDPVGATVEAGTHVTLTVDAAAVPSPRYYIWSVAHNGPGQGADQPVEGSNGLRSIVVAPLETTDYFAKVGNGIQFANDCSIAYSRIARVHVTSCKDITIVQPPDAILGHQDVAVTLNVQASASAPLKYRWFMGESGDMSHPVPTNIDGAPSLRMTYADHLQDPAATRFWVKVSFDTPPGAPKRCAVDSRTVRVCRLPRVYNPIGEYTNSGPRERRVLEVGVFGDDLTYAWYEGEGSAATSLPSQSNAVPVWPVTTTKYWVKITSACAPAGTTTILNAEVSVCPNFSDSPTADRTRVSLNERTTLHADVARGDRIEWFTLSPEGAATSVPDMAGANPSTIPITATTRFFARAWSGICHRDSEPVTINLCDGPHISLGNPLLMLVQKGKKQTLSAYGGVNDGPLAWQWYRGAKGDVANSITVSQAPAFDTYPDETQTLWVRGTKNTTGCYGDSPLLTLKVCVPTILEQPKTAIVNSGTSTMLSVRTDELPGVTYQWYAGPSGNTSVKLDGQTSSTFTTPNLTADTTYWVRVIGCDGTMAQDSDAVTVTICRSPAITQQPSHKTLAATGSVEISVAATGTELSYQWYKGAAGDVSTPIADSNTPARTENPPYTTKYWVRITGRCGTIDSVSATVARPPVIQAQPAGGPITKGMPAQLSVSALGNELAYQWYQRTTSGAVVLEGKTTATLNIAAVNVDSTYFCRVFSGSTQTALAQKDSADAMFTVCQPSTFHVVGYPTKRSGFDVTLQVDSPDANETYQWFSVTGGTATQVGTGTTIIVRPLVTTDYFVRTVRTACTADSPVITITICQPSITAEPQSVSTIYGTSTRLAVAATGNPALSYQWYLGASGVTSAPISLATNSWYDTPATASTASYWVRVSSPPASACSLISIDSATATVTVCQPPAIAQSGQPKAQIVSKGMQATVSVTATGQNLHYQWYQGAAGDVSKPVGFDSSSYTFYANTTMYLWVRVTGSCGPARDSTPALQSVIPQISQQPVAFAGCGPTHSYSVVAAGADVYKWYSELGTNGPQLIGNASGVTLTVSAMPLKVWVELESGLATAKSNVITISTIKPYPTVESFTATLSASPSTYIISAKVPQAEKLYVGYKFYQGAMGNTSTLLLDSTQSYKQVTVPTKPAKYWVRVYFLDTLCYTDREVTIQ